MPVIATGYCDLGQSMKKLVYFALLVFCISTHASSNEKYKADADFWAKRLNTSVVYQFLYNDAIADTLVTTEEYEQLKHTYTEESKNAEITLDAYKQVLALKKETPVREFHILISELANDGKLTHFEVDLIIEKYKQVTNR